VNSRGNILRVWLPVVLFGVLWADLVRQLSYTWESNEQYAYGWFVPILALALFWKRWLTRPRVHQPSTINHQPPPWLIALVVMAALALLPIQVVYEINPDWPLPGWLMALVAVGLSLYAVFLTGGWPWARHFAFPVCFILVAVAWPYRIEHGLTQGLMRVVANSTVEALGWFNIPALQRGNLIEISTGVVGIDEACSGIRSFQSTLMAALFLGELYLLKWHRRILLLVGGVALSFCLNVVRTLILTWHASTAGLSALGKWHDPAGMMIFLLSFACLWAIAVRLRALIPQPSTLDSKTTPTPQPSTLKSETTPLPQPSQQSTFNAQLVTLPSRYLLAIGCWAICVLALTELWYRLHDSQATGVFYWSASFPTNNPTFATIELNEKVRRNLRHDVGSTAKWTEDDGTEWSGFFFRWNPGPVRSIISARLHRPDICLPASGFRLVTDAGLDYFEVGALQIPFRKYTYDVNGGPVHVFFCQWEDGSEKQIGMLGSKGADRVRTALSGRRHLGQQTLELVLSGYVSLAEARQAVRTRLPALVRTTGPSVHQISDRSELGPATASTATAGKTADGRREMKDGR